MKLFTQLILGLIVGLGFTQVSFSSLEFAEPSDYWSETEPKDIQPGNPKLNNEDWMKYVSPKVFKSA